MSHHAFIERVAHTPRGTATTSVLPLLLGGVASAAAQPSSSAYTEPYQRRALEIFRTSIGYRTAATHGQVPALAAWLAGQFREGGFPAEFTWRSTSHHRNSQERRRDQLRGRREVAATCPSTME